MNKKVFCSILIVLAALIALLCWKLTITTIILLGVAFLVFGKEKTKSFLLSAKEKATAKIDLLYSATYHDDDEKFIIKNVSAEPTPRSGYFQVVILTTTDQTFYLKPTQNALVPEPLKINADFIVRKSRDISLKGVKSARYVVVGNEAFEIESD